MANHGNRQKSLFCVKKYYRFVHIIYTKWNQYLSAFNPQCHLILTRLILNLQKFSNLLRSIRQITYLSSTSQALILSRSTNPNIFPSMTNYLEVRVESALGHEFVDADYWYRMKQFSQWPPSDIFIHDLSIVYSVPSSQVAFGNPDSRYAIWSDFGCQNVSCKEEQVVREIPFRYTMREIKVKEDAVFRLIEECVFNDMTVITRDVHCHFLLDSHPFEVIFYEGYRCPMVGQRMPDFWNFSAPPRYEILIRSPMPCSIELMEEFCLMTVL